MSGSCQRLRLPSFASLGVSFTPASSTSSSSSAASSPSHRHRRNTRPSVSGPSARAASQHQRSVDHGGRGRPMADQHRIILMGSERVGKTCIVTQFLYDRFTTRYRRTTEDLHRGEYELADGSTLTLDILDTCGAMEFPAMRRLSIQFGDAFVLVFAVDDVSTWKEVESLRQVILESRGPNVPIVVVGNKCDVDDTHRQIARDEAESTARQDWRCGYVECSAKENAGIVEVFKALLKQAKISYNLSPAVRRRRMSMPAVSAGTGGTSASSSKAGKYSMKRHSCTVT